MKKPINKTIAWLILKTLVQVGEAALDSFFPAKYPQARLWRNILGLDSKHQFSKKSFSVSLSRLQKQELVKRTGSKVKSIWKITNKGKIFFKDLAENEEEIKEDGILRLVCFDIAENERKKRNLIREKLKNSGYVKLQQSVWLGKKPLPESFIDTINKLEISSSVHIFSVDKTGTL